MSEPQPQEQSKQEKTNITEKNPITQEELQAKIKSVFEDNDKFNRFQKEQTKRLRYKMQHAKYIPTEEFKGHPLLAETDENGEDIYPEVAIIGNTQTNNDVAETAEPTSNEKREEEAQQAANAQEKPSEGLKG
jgi:hypothetical protein